MPLAYHHMTVMALGTKYSTQFPRLGAFSNLPAVIGHCLIPPCNTDYPNYTWSCSVVVITRDFDSRWSPAGKFPGTQVRTLAGPSSGIFFKPNLWQTLHVSRLPITVVLLAKNRTQLFPTQPWRRIVVRQSVAHPMCRDRTLALPRTGHSSFRHGHDRQSL